MLGCKIIVFQDPSVWWTGFQQTKQRGATEDTGTP